MPSVLILASAAILTAVYCVVVLFDDTEGQLISPLKVWAALGALTTVPYLFLLGFGVAEPSSYVVSNIYGADFETLVAFFSIMWATAVLALLLGYLSIAGRTIGRAIAWVRFPLPAIDVRVTALILVALGAMIWGIMIIRIGGIWEIVANLAARNALFSGHGYLFQSGATLMTIGVLLGVYSIGKAAGPVRLQIAMWVLIAIFVALALSISGGRKGTIHLALSSLFVWHYCVRRIERVSASVVIGAVLLFAYFIILLLIRLSGGVESVMDDPQGFLDLLLGSFGIAFRNLSYVDTYIFIISWFERDALWFGAGFADLLQAWAPSALFPDKPPIDDGRYIMSLAEGWRVAPGMAIRELFPSSLPPETFGTGLMNFGFPGVVSLFIVLGVVFRSAQAWMEATQYNFFPVVVFSHVLLNFEISNLRIVQFVITIIMVGLVWFLIWGVARVIVAPEHSQRRRGAS